MTLRARTVVGSGRAHVLAAFRPPPQAMVYALGDSITRESISSDSAWTRQLRNRAGAAGKAVPAAFTLAGHSQTFGMDGQLVAAIPPRWAGQPRGIVLIGFGLSGFIEPPDKQTPAALAVVQAAARAALDGAPMGMVRGRSAREPRRPGPRHQGVQGEGSAPRDPRSAARQEARGLPSSPAAPLHPQRLQRPRVEVAHPPPALHEIGRDPDQGFLGHASPSGPRRPAVAVASLERAPQAPAGPDVLARPRRRASPPPQRGTSRP